MPTLWRSDEVFWISWSTFGGYVTSLRSQIEASGWVPTRLLAISRGGLPLATALANGFHLQGLHVLSLTRNLSDARRSRRANKPRFVWSSPLQQLTQEHVLVIDDISGDGGTLRAALELLATVRPSTVRTAVIARNANGTFIPDYVAVTVDRWVVFPWEGAPSAEPGQA